MIDISNFITDLPMLLTNAPSNSILPDASETATATSTVAGTGTPDGAENTPSGAFSDGWMIIVMYAAMAVGAYFLLFRGPRKERKKKEEMRSQLKVGDSVVTTAGFYGKIVDEGQDCFIIEFGTNRGMRVPVRKEAIEGAKEPKLTKESIE